MARQMMDISAMLINRTAVGFLIRDTIRAFKDHTAGYQAFGEQLDAPDITEIARNRLVQRFHAAVGNGSISPSAPPITLRRLFFDPIYTLFGPLKESDYVFILDMTPFTNPGWHNPNVSRLYEQAFRRILASRCHTIHISRNTLLTMRAVLGSEGPKASVLHLYIRRLRNDPNVVSPHSFDLGKYLLFVGSLEERKNITGLICAFDMSRLARSGYKLVIAGGDGHGAAAIHALAGRTPGVSLLGYVSDSDLHHLYEHATAFIYPSYLEGFGVPLLEAMAYGLPCVASMTGASPEVGGSDVMYVDPCDVPAISQAIRDCVEQPEELRQQTGMRLKTRAGQGFTFERYQAELEKILSL